MITYFLCYNKTKPKQKPNLRRENTPYPKQSVIDLDDRTIDQVDITSNIEQEYLPGTGILHVYKKINIIIYIV